MAKNRRRHPRVRARGVAAHLRTEHGRTACQVENVSMGGLFVRTDRLEEVGTEIFVDLVKPGWKRQLTINARITSRVDAIDGRLSRRMPGMGIQFLKLDDKQHERLESLLRELGATDEDLQVTLPEENAEDELRALELELDAAAQDPLDPQPQPLWQQVQMVEAERRPSLVEAAIEGALQESEIAAAAEALDAESFNKAEPAPAPAPAPGSDPVSTRLTLQVRGLVMQLSDAQQQLTLRDLEIQRLKEELATVRSALERFVRKT